MDNTISADDKKPILNSKEKRRFSQISEQFFKGSRDFFVEQQEKTQKFINEKLKKSSFYEHYQDTIQNVKDTINDKTNVIKNNLKKNLGNKIMNFIILLEIGVIAASQCPFNLEGAKKFMGESLNQMINFFSNDVSFDGIIDFLKQTGININKDIFVKDILKIIQDVLIEPIYIFSGGINYFLNNRKLNAFIICLGECALKVGESAGGAVGYLFDIIKNAAKITVSKRPELQHFLILGREQHQTASNIENAAHAAVGINENLSLESVKIGIWYNGQLYGIVNENITEDDDEIDDANRVLDNLRQLRLSASAESIRRFVGSYNTGTNILQTESYQKMVQEWLRINAVNQRDENGNIIGVMYDLTGLDRANLWAMVMSEDTVDVSEIQRQKNNIWRFYIRYKNSSNPFAKKICDEIERWLFVDVLSYNRGVLESKREFMGQQIKGYFPVVCFVFAPAIIYAIWEFEHMQELTNFMYQNINYNLSQREINILGNRDTEALDLLREIKEKYDIGFYNYFFEGGIASYFWDLNEVLNCAWDNKFENVKKLRPDVILPEFQNFAYIVNVITKPFEMLKIINNLYNNWFLTGENNTFNEDIARFFGSKLVRNTTYNVTYTSSNVQSSFQNSNAQQSTTTESIQEDRNMHQWRNLEQMLKTISIGSREKKEKIKKLMSYRADLWDVLNEISIRIQDDNLYPGNTIQRPTT